MGAIKITVTYEHPKGNSTQEIIICDYIDYCYSKALFNALLEIHANFTIERVLSSGTEET